MAVEEPERGSGRPLFGEVPRAQPAHRRDERGGSVGQRQREPVGAPFVVTRPRVAERRQQQRHTAGRQRDQRQRGQLGRY